MHVLKHSRRNNGHVHVAVDLACAQARSGHAVTFVSGPGSFDALLRDNGVRMVVLRGTDSARRAGWSALDLLRAVLESNPDIIHAHMMSSAALAFPMTKFTSAKLVTTMHNSFDGHSTLMRLGKVVVAVSEAERENLLRRRFPAKKVVTVLNGAANSPRDSAALSPFPDPLARPCLLSVSGLHPRKAVDDIVIAFSKALPANPNWHLHIVGSGPSETSLRHLVADLGLSKSVHFIGPVQSSKPLLEQADIFVSASLADPCPLTTTEARAAGCAIVATAVGGVPEVLDHGEAGSLVPASDPDALASALQTLMSDEQSLNHWRERSRLNAEHFSVARVASDYEAVYRSAMG